jgi:allantoin racemase
MTRPAAGFRVLLMNPNSRAASTRAMVAIAQRYLPFVEGWTAPEGPSLLTNRPDLVAAGRLVAAADIPAGVEGVIVAAFGDPGCAALRARLGIPVIGIGESAALAASIGGRPYAVVTHTPELVAAVDELMRLSAPGANYLGTFLAHGEALALSADSSALDAALSDAAHRAHGAGAAAVIIGGGPLGEAAERLRERLPCTLIAPIPEAARRLLSRFRGKR